MMGQFREPLCGGGHSRFCRHEFICYGGGGGQHGRRMMQKVLQEEGRKRAIVAGFLSNPSSGTLGPCEGISGWKRGRERPATGIGRHDNARELEVTWTIGRPIWSRRVGLARNVDRSASVVSVWRAESSRTNVNNAAEVKFVNKVMWIVVRPEK
jgi:hypothetical protein